MKRRSRHWLWLLLVIPVGIGVWRLRFDVEVLNLLPSHSRAVQGVRLFQEHFANARELIVTLRAADAGEAEAAARLLAEELRRAPALVRSVHWQPPWQEHPGQSAEFLAYLWFNQPPNVFAGLSHRLSDDALKQSLDEAREQLATSLSPDALAHRGYDPFKLTALPGAESTGLALLSAGGDFFSSPDGRFRVLFVESAADLAGYKRCIAWMNDIRAGVDKLRASPEFPRGIEVGYTGRPAFVAEIGGGMQSDFAGPSAITLVIIGLLFYVTHRRFRPLLWLVVLLALILAATLAMGGLVYGTLNVVSLGFASILLGLAEDFGIVLYEESRANPGMPVAEVRRLAMPGIVWSAVTTAGAFFLLNLSVLPGLRQMGTLVAIGIALAAVIMLYGYLPPLAKSSISRPAPGPKAVLNPGQHRQGLPWMSLFIVVVALVLLLVRPPTLDHSTETLRPKHSAAYATVDEMKRQLGRAQDPWWLLVPGSNEREVADKLAVVQPRLSGAVAGGELRDYTLPTQLWPQPGNQETNRAALAAVLSRRNAMRTAAGNAGFTSNSLALAEAMFATWERAAATPGAFWPTNAASRWVFDQFSAQPARGSRLALPLHGKADAPNLLALGLLYPATNPPPSPSVVSQRLGADVLVTGWAVLGQEVFDWVGRDLVRVLVPMFVLLVVSLWLAFRRIGEVFLSLASLGVSALLLHVFMLVAGWSWNLMNLMALPLLLGIGVDFSIHMQLSLRRHEGDTRAVRSTVGRALLLAGSTTIAGFASLSFASNSGIASLGQVCAVGITCCLWTATGLLPAWWTALAQRRPMQTTQNTSGAGRR